MRNNTLDFAKFVASFFIVVVHSGSYPEMSPGHAELFRASARWAVPFFFLVSGYLMGRAGKIDAGKKFNKLFSILFYSSLIYVPLIYLSTNHSPGTLVFRLFSFDTLRSGTWFHLWFITSLMSGIALTNFIVNNVRIRVGLAIAVLIIMGYWLSDIGQAFAIPAGRNSVFYVFRTLLGFPLVYIGYLLERNGALYKISLPGAWATFIVGLVLMLVELPMWKSLIPGYIQEMQFPLFSVPVALALLVICVNTKMNENFISKAGRDYSLGIYLVHPFFLYFIGHYLERIGVKVSLINLVSAFLLSLLLFFVLKGKCPALFNKINGIGIK